MLLRSTLLALLSVLVSGSAADEPPSDSGEAIVAEISAASAEFNPSGPANVRFTLWNRSNAVAEIPYRGAPPEAFTLPLEVVLGAPDAPSLFVARESPTFEAVLPDLQAKDEQVLRIAPRSGVGIEIDLIALNRAFRMTGAYTLEWRPLGGKLATASTRYRVEVRKQAVLVTDYGKITFNLEYDKAPRNVANFLDLVRSGFYDGKTIHRLIGGDFMQGGDPKGDGSGVRPDGKFVPAEFSQTPFKLGTLAMARKPNDPNSASCQFLVTFSRSPDLDGVYTVIGQASDEESFRTLHQLATIKTDRKWRPLKPLIIRSFALIDAPEEGPVRRELELTPRDTRR